MGAFILKRFLPVLIATITLIASGALVAQNNLIQHYQIAPTIKYNDPHTLSGPTSFRARSTNRPLKSGNTSGANTALIFQQLQQAVISSNQQAPDSRYGIPPLISTKQMNALKVLNKQSRNNKAALVYFDSKSGTPAFIKSDSNPPNISARGSRDEISKASAMHFLRANKDLLKLENPEAELELVHSQIDSYGKHHFQYRQMFAGIPVWGSDLKLHLKSDNSVYLMNGRFQPTITNLNTTPSITQADAEEKVLKDLNTSWVATISSDLMVFKKQSGEAALTYKVEVQSSMAERWIYFIDATKGELVHKINNFQEIVVTGQGQDSNGDLRSFNAWSESGIFYMVDPTTPLNDPIHDPINETKPLGDTYILDARNGDGSSLFNSTSNNVDSNWDPVAVSAMANTKIVYDYYLNTHGRQSIDDNNKNLMVAIHFGNNYGGAFWSGTFMVYGDGDGTVFGPLARCLDVAAHEMTHGVVETTAGLIYENQSGALNESFSDIFGAMVDRDDWLMGEDCTIASPGYLRNMQDPSQGLDPQPTKMSEYQNLPNTPDGDNGGVHVNSGIPNRAAYLIAEGLTAEGSGTSIGKDKMEQIFYRALTTYLTSSSQFIDARRATIQAAEDIHGPGSAEVQAVANGWDVVEVVEGSQPTPDNPNPTPTDAISGSDIMIYLYPVDGTRDFEPTDLYSVKLQSMNDPLVYDSALDKDLLNTVSAASSVRPVV